MLTFFLSLNKRYCFLTLNFFMCFSLILCTLNFCSYRSCHLLPRPTVAYSINIATTIQFLFVTSYPTSKMSNLFPAEFPIYSTVRGTSSGRSTHDRMNSEPAFCVIRFLHKSMEQMLLNVSIQKQVAVTASGHQIQ